MANTYLPISISLKNRKILVVGGGNVALRKIETLLDYEASITVVAPSAVDKVGYYAQREMITLEKREYKIGEAAQFGLVISASDSEDVNRQVHDDCRAASVPVNVVDNPALCDFIFPAVVRRNCLSVAVSSDGKAPFLSGHLRYVLENIFPDHWNELADVAASFRLRVHEYYKGNAEQRMAAFERFVGADWKEILKKKDPDALEAELQRLLRGE
jgi:siroheme synthase-like protein